MSGHPPNANDHDLLIQLNSKVDSLSELNEKVDSLMELKTVIGTILVRLNGHIPDKCITHEANLSRVTSDFAAYKSEHAQLHEAQKNDSANTWRTVVSVIALVVSIAIPLIGWLRH